MRDRKLLVAIGLFVLTWLASWIVLSPVRSAGSERLYLPMLHQTSTQTPTQTPGQQNPLHTGRATYYDATGAGNCAFDASPGNLMVAAISHVDYGNPDPEGNPSGGKAAVYCGAYVEVYGPSGTVTVRIVDKCPDDGCQAGHLDLSREAFAKIADPALGIVPITWRVVSPAISGPIQYHFKDGSNQWWTAVQIRNHRNPIVKFEYLNGSGTWVEVTRVDYNYFVQTNPGMGPGPYSFRVTDSYGNVLTDTGIVGGDNVTRNGHGQFPVGP